MPDADTKADAAVINTVAFAQTANASNTANAQAVIDASTISGGPRRSYDIRFRHGCLIGGER